MPWTLTPSHHGIEYLLDEAGEVVGQVEHDPVFGEWIASACPERFPAGCDLPDAFGGRSELRFPRRPDLLKAFGLPLPVQSDTLTPGRRAAA